MAPHSSTLAWKIPWTEEPGGLQSRGSLRVGHDWATSLSLFTLMHWRRKWQPTPVFLPGGSQGWGSLVGCRPWGHTESATRLKQLSSKGHFCIFFEEVVAVHVLCPFFCWVLGLISFHFHEIEKRKTYQRCSPFYHDIYGRYFSHFLFVFGFTVIFGHTKLYLCSHIGCFQGTSLQIN